MRLKYSGLLVVTALILGACSSGGDAASTKTQTDAAVTGDGASLDGNGGNDALVGNDAALPSDSSGDDSAAQDVSVLPDAGLDDAGTDAQVAPDVGVLDTVDAGPLADAQPDETIADSVGDAAVDTGPADAGPADATAVVDANSADVTADVSVDAGPQPGVYAGHCVAGFTPPAKTSWKSILTAGAVLTGGPNHGVRDSILLAGQGGKIQGDFSYGAANLAAAGETVQLWIQTCPGWVSLGSMDTDSNGSAVFAVPADLAQGDYQVKMVLLGDLSVADGVLAIWPKGVQAVITDIDGTLTTSDWQAINDILFGSDAQMYPDANTLMNAWAAKDYRLVYLTGRPQSENRYTRNWLAKHGFPVGPMHLTDDLASLIPTAQGVQKFKSDYLASIQSGVSTVFKPGYGNATTDVGAYEAAGLAKTDIYIIGTNAGYDGTQPVTDYTAHLPVVQTYANAVQP